MAKPFLCLDAGGVLRGSCERCQSCTGWSRQAGQQLRFSESSASPGAGSAAGSCEACGCPAQAHRELGGWLRDTSRWVRCLRCSDGAWPETEPPSARLPVAASNWAPAAAALHVVSGGQFEPERDGRSDAKLEGADAENLVSLVCTTLEKDQPSHPLLYESFRKQTYEPRELVIVDTGTCPSSFLQEKAQQDPRVVYRFFFREEHGLEQAEDPYERILKQDDPDDIIEWTEYVEEMPDMDRAEVRWEGFSLGLKRNIACHLARGPIIMHFNVNALYVPEYVRVMRDCVLGAKALQDEEGRALAGVSLVDWHTLDFDEEEFRLMDTERRGSEVPEVKRQQVAYGKGLTYSYTRACWELAPFPDIEEPEGHLARSFRREGIPFSSVRRPNGCDALVAFGFLKESTTGESATANINLSLEIQLLEMCSSGVYLPRAFADSGLLPLTREIVSTAKSKQSGGLQALLQAEGACFFCKHCDAAIALRRYLKVIKQLGDGAGGKVQIAQFSRAGGAVAEGAEATYEEPPKRQQPRPTPALRGRAAFPYGAGAWGAGRGGLGPAAPFALAAAPAYAGRGGLASFGRHPLNGSRALGLQSHQTQALAAQARALGRGTPNFPAQRATLGATLGSGQRGQAAGPIRRLVPEPEPEDAAWFPGWWRRNAACRQCGNNIGWRYENEQRTIFWVLETAFLQEREAEPQPVPQRLPLPQKVEVSREVPPAPVPVQVPVLEPPGSFAPTPRPSLDQPPERPQRDGGVAAPKKDPIIPTQPELRQEQQDLTKEPAQPLQPGRGQENEGTPAAAANAGSSAEVPKSAASKGKEAEKAEKSLETAKKAVRAFSPQLQQHLAQSIMATDRSKFDQTLNELKLDDATRRNILQELRVRPGVAATQVEHLVAKNFKGKVNQLRSAGLKVLRVALEAELPAGLLETLQATALKAAKAAEETSGDRSPSQSPPGKEGQAAENPAKGGSPLPVPPGWEVEWSDACQCYQYYNEDGQKFFQPPKMCEDSGRGEDDGTSSRMTANPQEADL